MTENEIHEICYKYNIDDYSINSDMSIDVNQTVDLYNKSLKELPINFNKINGTFICDNNNLTSLKGSPKEVSHDFFCRDNNLITLKDAPILIGGNLHCDRNRLIELNKNIEVYSIFFDENDVKDLISFPNIKGITMSDFNPIYQILQLFESPSCYEHIEFFNDLDIIQQNGEVVILERLNYFLQDLGFDETSGDSIIDYKII